MSLVYFNILRRVVFGQEMTSPLRGWPGTFIFFLAFVHTAEGRQQRYFGPLLLMTKSFGNLRAGRDGSRAEWEKRKGNQAQRQNANPGRSGRYRQCDV